MGAYDAIIGALLIGSWLNCALYTCEIFAAYHYFKRFTRDPIPLKAVICAMLLVDTANTILQNVTVYLMTVTHFGDVAFLAEGTVFFALQVLLPSTTAMICQNFLIYRFWQISKNYAVAALLACPVLGAYILVIYTTVALVVYTSLEDRLRVVTLGTAWLSLESGCDILIASALIVQFFWYSRRTTFSETKSLLKRLMVNAAETGAFTATVALGMLVAFLLSKQTNINTGFSYVLGRCYSLTLFLNLHLRARQDGSDGEGTSSNQNSFKKSGGGNMFGVSTYRLREAGGTTTMGVGAGKNTGLDGQIDVNREVTVHIDAYNDDKRFNDGAASEEYELTAKH